MQKHPKGAHAVHGLEGGEAEVVMIGGGRKEDGEIRRCNKHMGGWVEGREISLQTLHHVPT